MNDTYAITDENGRVLDVIHGLCPCIGQQAVIERLNNFTTKRRLASSDEIKQAHVIQKTTLNDGISLG